MGDIYNTCWLGFETEVEPTGSWYKEISSSLETKSNALLENPEYARLVRKVT